MGDFKFDRTDWWSLDWSDRLIIFVCTVIHILWFW